MKTLAIIPARYESSRFPGKPLVEIGGKLMVHRVYLQAAKVFDHVVVATDDDRIFAAVKGFDGRVVMTDPNHQSGTDRCAEALEVYQAASNEVFDVVVNIQGDEPFISENQLLAIKACFDTPETDIATLVIAFDKSDGLQALKNPNSPKVVLNKESRAIYFSRSVIPYLRGVKEDQWLERHTFYKHIGLYAYRTHVLNEITKLPQGILELTESLEQLRWIENGYTIKVAETNEHGIGIDTPEDLKKVIKLKLWERFDD